MGVLCSCGGCDALIMVDLTFDKIPFLLYIGCVCLELVHVWARGTDINNDIIMLKVFTLH